MQNLILLKLLLGVESYFKKLEAYSVGSRYLPRLSSRFVSNKAKSVAYDAVVKIEGDVKICSCLGRQMFRANFEWLVDPIEKGS